jgi:hypothetical protein
VFVLCCEDVRANVLAVACAIGNTGRSATRESICSGAGAAATG